MIELDAICCGYGETDVLKDVSLSFGPGEMVGILGPNGSGKTTLLMALSGVLPLRAGSITLDGQRLETMEPRQRAQRMASVPQRLDNAFDLRVLPLVLMGRYPYISFLGGYSERDREIALEAMRNTRTEPFRDRLTGEISGGEFQRVLIARALAQEADVLLLDEAASGLDIARKLEIHDLLRQRNRDGVCVLSAIHDLNLAALYCERLVFLKEGRVAIDGATQDVFTEENLLRIYDTHIKVFAHPTTGAPQGHLVPGDGAPVFSGNSGPR
jgi:iron complex transport system ATP-binding protein